MDIKTLVFSLCLAATALIVFTETGVIQVSEPRDSKVVKMPKDDFKRLAGRICGTDDVDANNKRDLECYVDLYYTHIVEGIKSAKLNDRLSYWSHDTSSRNDNLMGHTHLSSEMLNYQLTYSYKNYLEPILLEANDMTARSARDIAGYTLFLAALVSIVSLILYSYTKPDCYALPMPNFYETSRTRRNSPVFNKIQNYFYGPKSLDLPLPGGYCNKEYRYNL